MKLSLVRSLVSFTALFIVSYYVAAQKNTGSIRGRIFDAEGKAVTNISVELKKLKKIAITGVNGFFIIQHLPPLQDTLVISSVDSKITFRQIKLENHQAIDVGIIQLEYIVKQLQLVEITSHENHSYKSDYSFFGNKTETPSKDIPQSISTITKELIKDKMEFTLKDAVNDASGVNQYSGYDEYTIRGFRAENARDINGLRGYNTTYTSGMLVNIERIEVIKGPTATLYGNCDPGGTINLVTKKPLDKSEASVNGYMASWDHYRAAGDITGPLNESKTLLYRFNAGYDNTQSFREQFYARSFQIAPSLTFLPNDKFRINLDFSISHINTILDRGQPGFLNDSTLKSTPIKLSVTQPGDFLHETDIASVISASYRINNHFGFNLGFLNYITQQNVADHGLNDYISPDSIYLYYTTWNYHTTTNTITNYFTYQVNTGSVSHQLLAGYDFIRSKVNLNQQYYELPDQFGVGSGIVGTFSLKNPKYISQPVNSYFSSDYDNDGTDVDDDIYQTQGIYVQDQLNWNKWKFLVSLREELYKGGAGDSAAGLKENVFLPRMGIVYSLTSNANVYATYNKGFDPFEASTGKAVFNMPFKPITSELLEAGIKTNFFNNKLATSVALYQLRLQNVAVNANNISNPNLFVQQGEDRSRGIEAEASGNIFANLSVMFSYAYCVAVVTKSKIAADVGTRVENSPHNASNSWIKYTFIRGFAKRFGIAVGHSQVSVRNTLDPKILLPGYYIINAGIHYHYKHFTIATNLNNIANKIYWAGAYNNVSKWPGTPRNFMINLGCNF